MAESQSSEEEVKNIILKKGGARPHGGSVVPFSFDNDCPTSVFIGQTENTTRTLKIHKGMKKVANLVLIKKLDNKWRMCIDFKDLNKACPKDLYPLPEIDWKIESVMGFNYKCFLDAYKGFHQIQMAMKDEEKMAFHTDEGVFCYMKMPFGLKNAGATYQRLVDTIFEGKMGRNLEAYVDDMVIKRKTELEMIKDAEETLLTLKKAEEAFQTMKKLIAELPTLTAPKKEEELTVYLSAANEAVSAVLLVERDGRQITIHYVSRTLQGAEINYPPMEKLVMALVHAARRLKRYFQCHTIKVITDKRINQILNNREATGRLAKWGVELEAYGIKYTLRSAIKGQVLANFLADTMAEGSPAQAKADEASLILIDPEGAKYSYALRLNFANSNNDAEYEALLVGLRIATKMKVENMHAFVDSKLVANQVWSTSHHHKGKQNQAALGRRSMGGGKDYLAYGTEAVIPAEKGIPTSRTIQGSDKENKEALRLNLNLLEERREIEAIREARRKQQVEKYYN
ncbi:reverse transcriptase domain-containing protein [Tanacetum coccineum]